MADPKRSNSVVTTAGDLNATRVSPALFTLSDITAHLVWPRLLRAPRMAFSPHRIGLVLVGLAIVGLLDSVGGAILSRGQLGGPLSNIAREFPAGLDRLILAARSLDAGAAGRELVAIFTKSGLGLIQKPGGGLDWGAFTLLVLLVPLAVSVLGVVGCAVSRSVAMEFALARHARWTEHLSFALARWKAVAGAIILPLVAAWVLCLVLAMLGGLLKVGVLGVIAAALLPVAFVIAGACVLVFCGVLGGSLMIPACVACDDADAFDAVSRTYAFVYAQPLRLILYVIISTIAALGGVFVVGMLVSGILALIERCTGVPVGSSNVPESVSQLGANAQAITRFWAGVLTLGVASYALASAFAAGTLVYLALRRTVDGQDEEQLALAGAN